MLNWSGKRMLALALSAELALSGIAMALPAAAEDVGGASGTNAPAAGTPYDASGAYDPKVPHVVINQIYGGGGSTDAKTYISNGFIELYNPTEQDIDLSQGWSLQYTDPDTNAKSGWQKLNLTGTIKSHGSYLVTGAATGASGSNLKLDISDKGDQRWQLEGGALMPINNKRLKVVLLSDTTSIPNSNVNPYDNKPAGYVDMLGAAGNDDGTEIDGYENDYPSGSNEGNSKKLALRRTDFADRDNNRGDFKQVDYSSISSSLLDDVKPRSGADGSWGTAGDALSTDPLTFAAGALPKGRAGTAYAGSLPAVGGVAPYRYAASGLPQGLTIAPDTGAITGQPAAGAVGDATVTLTVADAAAPATTIRKKLTLTIEAADNPDPSSSPEPSTDPEPETFENKISITKIAGYSVGTQNPDGGVAEIVQYNKDNRKFYLVNGSTNPPSLEIVELKAGQETLTRSGDPVNIEALLADDPTFAYGDLTSVDVNEATDRIAVAVQEADPLKNGKILVLDYDGGLIASYEAGVQPDMVKWTADGRYILTADEGEPRTPAGDPDGSVTIVDTTTGTVKHVKFNDEWSVGGELQLDDLVHIRGASSVQSPTITTQGTKADAQRDMEPEFITLSADEKTAYVSLQDNNAIGTIDIASGKLVSVKGLGYKDYSLPRNSIDLIKDGKPMLQNVPFKGLYMPDGIDTLTVGGKTYLLSANEGDGTEWPDSDDAPWRVNVGKVKDIKKNLDPNSEAAQFLAGKTTYDSVEALTDMGGDGIYLFGGRSFSIWDADTMQQVYDSGNEFEAITAQFLPNYFNANHTNTTIDDRSTKKGPEPEYVKLGQVGNHYLAFTGLERIGGIMTYDVTDPAHATFVNYMTPRDFTKGLVTDTGPEGLEFIPASISPTGLPLLLVANEVGGTVSVLQLNVSKVTLDQPALSLTAQGVSKPLKATVEPAQDVTWSSSDASVATVDASGTVKPLKAGTTTIRATTADGYSYAESVATVASAPSTGPGTPTPDPSQTPETPSTGTNPPATSGGGGETIVTTVASAQTGADGKATAVVGADQLAEALKSAASAAGGAKPAVLEIKTAVQAGTSSVAVSLPAGSLADIAGSGVDALRFDAGVGTITFDKSALGKIASAAASGTITLSVDKTDAASLPVGVTADARAAIGSRPVYQLSIATASGDKVSGFGGGTAAVSVPYTLQPNEDPSSVIIYYVADNGSVQAVPNAIYDAATGQVRFTVGHFSTYAVGYSKPSFADAAASFAKEEIAFLAARGIIGGTGEGRFEPKANITRADFALILARLAGADLSGFAGTAFTDVKADAYYASAVQWAAANGIAGGSGDGRFDPAAPITREQIAAMLARFATLVGAKLPAQAPSAAFADQDAIPAFAKDAAAAMQQAGILSGKTYAGKIGVYFAPKDKATREEAAKLLAKLLKIWIG